VTVGKFVIVLALLTLQIYALVDLVRADSDQVRVLPKALWFLVWLLPVIGPAAWLLLGRPQVGPAPGGNGGSGGGGISGGGPRPTRGPLAPDDDPDFLRRLDEQSWAARMERLRRERQGGPGPGQPHAEPGGSAGGEGGPAPESDAPTDGASA
jgi:Phospholipase_D-nuclease N-terminal